MKSYGPASLNLISSTVIVSAGLLFNFPRKTEKKQVTHLAQPVINILNMVLCIQLCPTGEQFTVHTQRLTWSSWVTTCCLLPARQKQSLAWEIVVLLCEEKCISFDVFFWAVGVAQAVRHFMSCFTASSLNSSGCESWNVSIRTEWHVMRQILVFINIMWWPDIFISAARSSCLITYRR